LVPLEPNIQEEEDTSFSTTIKPTTTTTPKNVETGLPTFQFLVDSNTNGSTTAYTENNIERSVSDLTTEMNLHITTHESPSTTYYVSISPDLQFTENGYFVVDNEYYNSDDFCIAE